MRWECPQHQWLKKQLRAFGPDEMMFSAFLQALLFTPLVFGVGVAWSFVRKVDLSPEGSFVLGACVFTQALMATNHHWLAHACAFIAGSAVGVFSYLIQINEKINDILAGLLTLFVLYSVNLIVLGKPNQPLFEYTIPFFGLMQTSLEQRILAAMLSTIFMAAICYAFSGKWGLLLRSIGSNKELLQKLGYKRHSFTFLAFMLNNGLAAFAGAQVAIVTGYADINMGLGFGVLSITTCVIGVSLLPTKTKNYWMLLIQCFFGLFCYFLLTHFIIAQSLPTKAFKLITGLAIITCLLLRKRKIV